MQFARDTIVRMISDEIGDVLNSVPPTFLGAIVTGIALAVGEDEVHYLGASAHSSPDIISLRVGVFTDGTVTTINAAFSPLSHTTDVTTRVHSRASLERLDIIGGAPSLGADEQTDWPGHFTVRATYHDGLELVIPMSDADTPQQRSSVWRILTGLRNDLATPR